MTFGETVAVVGAGRMGAAMVGRLRAVGVDVVVYNRTRSRAEEVAARTGATVADTPRDAVLAASRAPTPSGGETDHDAASRTGSGSGVVLVSLADDVACREAYGGPDGIAAGAGAGTVVADTSTIDPQTVAELAALVQARGGALLDTPVSGSVPVVERGELTVMAGGSAADLERARPVLDLLARQIFHVGPSGTGATMKLAVNAMVHALNQALAEALVLAERAGVERTAAYEVFAGSVAGAPFVQYKRRAYEHPESTPVAFSLDLVAKDLDLILALAARTGTPMPQTSANRQAVADAVRAGLGEHDMSALAQHLRR